MTEVFATGMQMGEAPRWHDGGCGVCDWLAGEGVVYDADVTGVGVARVDGGRFADRVPPRTGFAWTRRGRSGTPAFTVSDARASPKAARCWRRSVPTAVASRACSAATMAALCKSSPIDTPAAVHLTALC